MMDSLAKLWKQMKQSNPASGWLNSSTVRSQYHPSLRPVLLPFSKTSSNECQLDQNLANMYKQPHNER
jgi:hypothetical protein